MKLVACLCWYDEAPKMLAETVASLHFCDHLVAVDGAYALYPGATERPISQPDQTETILRVARGVGLGVTLHVPAEPYAGGEVEKRTLMFRLAAEAGADWLLVIDGDEVVTRAELVKERLGNLEDTTYVCDVTHREPDWGGAQWHRRLFRALPGLRVEGAHFVYVAPGTADRESGFTPRYLWGRPDLHDLEPAADFRHALTIEHRRSSRDDERNLAMHAYNTLRDSSGVERLHEYEVAA